MAEKWQQAQLGGPDAALESYDPLFSTRIGDALQRSGALGPDENARRFRHNIWPWMDVVSGPSDVLEKEFVRGQDVSGWDKLFAAMDLAAFVPASKGGGILAKHMQPSLRQGKKTMTDEEAAELYYKLNRDYLDQVPAY